MGRATKMKFLDVPTVSRFFYRSLQPVSIREIAYFLSTRNGTFVYSQADRVVAFFQICRFDGTQSAWLDFGAVDSNLKGSGVSEEAYQALEEVCRQSGYSDLRLAVDTGNRRAIRFYEKMGFTREPNSPVTSADRYHYTKVLTSNVRSEMDSEIFRIDSSPPLFRRLAVGILVFVGILSGVLNSRKVYHCNAATFQKF